MRNVRIIKNEEQYYLYLERLEEIFQASDNTSEGDERDLLVFLIEKYEQDQFTDEILDPIEVINVRMKDLNMNQTDLLSATGDKGNLSKILNGKRALTVQQIRRLSHLLNVPVELLVGQPTESQIAV